jgi:hypothetical protein
MQFTCNKRFFRPIATFLPLLALALHAGSGGSILGTVTDPHGGAVPGAKITATEAATGATRRVASDAVGFYSFESLPIGRYDVDVEASGFQLFRRTGVILDLDRKVVVDAALAVGQRSEAITVSTGGAHVETVETQMGEVIGASQMTAVPLNGRSFTDLLALQSGVVPVTSLTSDTTQDVGVSAFSPSGGLNPGTISINGQREFANAFIVNGSDVEEDVNMGTAIIPNLDSIAEFRILTNNFDAEYGEFSGGQINVVTKSGSNEFHGNAFEFLRNTDLDARNFFSPTRGIFQQNQFGGTLGGPIVRKKVFFFADYQGTRLKQGVDTGLIPVPSAADRSGDLSDLASSLTGSVNGQSWATQLSQKLGYTVAAGEPYYSPTCTNTSAASANGCVFPGAIIPTAAWSAPAQQLLQYIPQPNVAADTFSTSGANELLRDDKGAYRLDYDSRWGMLIGLLLHGRFFAE